MSTKRCAVFILGVVIAIIGIYNPTKSLGSFLHAVGGLGLVLVGTFICYCTMTWEEK